MLVTGTRYSGCQDSIARTLIKNSECFDSTMTKEERKSHNKKLKAVGNSSNSSEAPTSSQESTPNILSLNDDVFQEIFSHCSFDEVSKMRSVSARKRQWNAKNLYHLFRFVDALMWSAKKLSTKVSWQFNVIIANV